MLRCAHTWLILCTVVAQVALTIPAVSLAQSLRAAAATADITPQKWPLPMVGTFSERLATHAWDPLQARALVLDNGETRIGLVIVDSCYCPRELFDEAKRRAEEVCGIPADRILAAPSVPT
jgi:neutral ceramidase